MNFISILHGSLERSSAGSRATSQQVISLCGAKGKALFLGDEAVTPLLLKESGCEVAAAIADERRAATAQGVEIISAEQFELPQNSADFDLLWYNGTVEFDGAAHRLEQLRSSCKKGGTVVYRALCWLIEPSPDTRRFCESRFGKLPQMDSVLLTAREAGFRVMDFYIAPKTDWTENYYRPLLEAAAQYAASHGEDAAFGSGFGELKRETEIFELHCEEYSYVYYILKG